jgi:hypothetical protein
MKELNPTVVFVDDHNRVTEIKQHAMIAPENTGVPC